MRRSMILMTMALVVLTGLPGGLAAAQTPAASPVASSDLGFRQLDIEGRGFSLSPDGQWLAGVGPDQTACFWDVETLTPQCADEELPIMVHPAYPAMAWAPDSSAVVFSLDTPRMGYDSDIYMFEREGGALTNLTDDGYEGDMVQAPDGTPFDLVPSWSPDGQQIVFSRSVLQDDTSATSIMRVDRAGGEAVEVVTLDIEEPLVIWMPMQWLPDDTILYTLSAAKIDEPMNGLWRVGVDGGTPTKVLPGDASSGIPSPVAASVDPASGAMSVYSPILLAQYTAGFEQQIFWIGNLDDGEVQPLPYYDADQGVTLDPSSVKPTDVAAYPLLAFPASPATIAPGGASALVVYRNLNGEVSIAMMDVATGEVSMFVHLPPDVQLQPVAPQWTEDGSVLLLTGGGPILLTLAPAA